MMRNLLCTAVLAGFALSASAEPNRSILTKENHLPEPGQFEIGTEGYYASYEDSDGNEYAATPYLRLGVLHNLALTARLPVREIDPGVGDVTRGVGDASVGLEFRAYEDIFRYPYIIPYVDIFFPTGDEDEGLGRGETSTRVGVSVGTQMYDDLAVILDGRYDFISEGENLASVALALIWELDSKFALQTEVEYREEEVDGFFGPEIATPLLFVGGFSYRANDLLSFTLYMGTENNGPRESIGGGKLSLTF